MFKSTLAAFEARHECLYVVLHVIRFLSIFPLQIFTIYFSFTANHCRTLNISEFTLQHIM